MTTTATINNARARAAKAIASTARLRSDLARAEDEETAARDAVTQAMLFRLAELDDSPATTVAEKLARSTERLSLLKALHGG